MRRARGGVGAIAAVAVIAAGAAAGRAQPAGPAPAPTASAEAPDAGAPDAGAPAANAPAPASAADASAPAPAADASAPAPVANAPATAADASAPAPAANAPATAAAASAPDANALAPAAAAPAAPTAASSSTASAPAPAPPADGHARVELSAWMQVDAVAWAQDSLDELDPATRAPLNLTRVLIRRGRVRATYARGNVRGVIEFDGNTVDGPIARLLLANATWSWPGLGHASTTGQYEADGAAPEPLVAITAGLMTIPFGVDVPRPDRERVFLEPGWAQRALFPGNDDAGVMASGAWRFARIAIAVMNGAPVGDAQWKGRDPTAAPDLVGRAGVDVDVGGGARVRGGVSALVGTGLHPGTPPTKDQLTWVDANENGVVDPTEIQVIPGQPGEPSKTFARSALGADAAVGWCARGLGRGEAFGEVMIATNLDRAVVVADPVAASRDLRELGWQLGAWQELGTRAWAGARYDAYRPDRDASEVEGATIARLDPRLATLALAGAWRWAGGRLLVEYDHQHNPFGRGADGQPTTRAADRLTVRAQVEW